MSQAQGEPAPALAATGQYFTPAYMSEGRRGIVQVHGVFRVDQMQTAGTAIATATLIFHGVAGALQSSEQGLIALEGKLAAGGDEQGATHGVYRLKPSRSPAFISLSIWPTR